MNPRTVDGGHNRLIVRGHLLIGWSRFQKLDNRRFSLLMDLAGIAYIYIACSILSIGYFLSPINKATAY